MSTSHSFPLRMIVVGFEYSMTYIHVTIGRSNAIKNSFYLHRNKRKQTNENLETFYSVG